MADTTKLDDLRSRAVALATAIENEAMNGEYDIVHRENLLCAARGVDVAVARMTATRKVLRPSRKTEDDPVGTIPNERLEKAYREATDGLFPGDAEGDKP